MSAKSPRTDLEITRKAQNGKHLPVSLESGVLILTNYPLGLYLRPSRSFCLVATIKT